MIAGTVSGRETVSRETGRDVDSRFLDSALEAFGEEDRGGMAGAVSQALIQDRCDPFQ
jgi:hypothetical protein